MTSDQELNEAVARKLGWKPHNYNPLSMNPVERIPCFSAPNGDLYASVPPYSTSIAAAWEILEHVSRREGTMKIDQHGIGRPHYTVQIQRVPLPEIFVAISSSAPLAICLAFLKLP